MFTPCQCKDCYNMLKQMIDINKGRDSSCKVCSLEIYYNNFLLVNKEANIEKKSRPTENSS